ncbi:MAG TPA: SUMF1/EgtB/PvdO family nonheme iron enzyme, partial [Nitrospira sp.]|nr:SUMF1/EgtB/PvdO family nonheme iron enzyme [Nitrospira sp.]
MTQGLSKRRTRWSAVGLFATAAFTLALSPVLAAPPAKELDLVPMITIPAGSFIMGTQSPKGRADEWPQRKVHVDAFAIDQVEVTNERYLAFVATTGR